MNSRRFVESLPFWGTLFVLFALGSECSKGFENSSSERRYVVDFGQDDILAVMQRAHSRMHSSPTKMNAIPSPPRQMAPSPPRKSLQAVGVQQQQQQQQGGIYSILDEIENQREISSIIPSQASKIVPSQRDDDVTSAAPQQPNQAIAPQPAPKSPIIIQPQVISHPSTSQQPALQAPVPQAPIPQAPVSQAPVPQAPVPQAPVPQAPVPQAPVPQAPLPQAPLPQAPVPQAPVPQAPVPQSPVPQASVPQAPVPQAPVRQALVPQAPVPQAPAPQASVPQAPAPQTSVPQAPAPQVPVPQSPVPQAPVPQPKLALQTPVSQLPFREDDDFPEDIPQHPVMQQLPDPTPLNKVSQIPEIQPQGPSPAPASQPQAIPSAPATQHHEASKPQIVLQAPAAQPAISYPQGGAQSSAIRSQKPPKTPVSQPIKALLPQPQAPTHAPQPQGAQMSISQPTKALSPQSQAPKFAPHPQGALQRGNIYAILDAIHPKPTNPVPQTPKPNANNVPQTVIHEDDDGSSQLSPVTYQEAPQTVPVNSVQVTPQQERLPSPLPNRRQPNIYAILDAIKPQSPQTSHSASNFQNSNAPQNTHQRSGDDDDIVSRIASQAASAQSASSMPQRTSFTFSSQRPRQNPQQGNIYAILDAIQPKTTPVQNNNSPLKNQMLINSQPTTITPTPQSSPAPSSSINRAPNQANQRVTAKLPQQQINVVPSQAVPQAVAIDAVQQTLNQFGYMKIGGGKYAVVVNRLSTWGGADQACRSHLPGASLFTVNSAQDSTWLGNRINFEKERITGASKFWVGLFSRSAFSPLMWLDGTSYQSYPEVVQISGHDDNAKNFAWAVPDSMGKLKYEFLTADDEAEAFICQYVSI